MGRKIFVSYKYGDPNVLALPGLSQTKAKDYVNELQYLLEEHDHIYKGEQDGESLARFRDSTIETKLRDKIYDSSATIVLISPGMKTGDPEDDQWIPWEISYSLKEHSRNGRTSKSNAMLAVVLPDRLGSYTYYIEEGICSHCSTQRLRTDKLFKILSKNMFNAKKPEHSNCENHSGSTKIYTGDHSYIPSVKWDTFKNSVKVWLEKAERINDNIDGYDLVKEV